ncbi:Bystin-domain-containing protein [Dichotomocladium elegans]|nr:Bystin-domain-containing protein [Dichotomocladium elegans]
MGKTNAKRNIERHDPLHVELADNPDQGRKRKVVRQKFVERNQKEEQVEEYLDPKLSKRILKIAREQQEEMDDDNDNGKPTEKMNKISNTVQFPLGFDPSDDELDAEDLHGEFEELEVDEEDEEVLKQFLPNAPMQKRTLADIIMEKINEKNAMDARNASGEADESFPEMNPKVVEVYTKVGQLLSRYKSGKLPKAFKIIPSLGNWEEILFLTKPEEWSVHATYEATRMFVSNLKGDQAQKFMTYILLDRVREDIQENKKLNYHLYMALKKALYKPAAFFKGFLFPLCESGTCSLREAAIIGSVLSRVSIPVLHSSAALLRLAQMEYTGPNSLFIRILLDKKYALPFKVVDGMVEHFQRFRNDPRQMPVLWHQSLLVFVQRYKQDLVPEQKDIILDVVKHKFHSEITAEVRREIAHAKPRDVIEEMDYDSDILMD